MKRLAVVLSSAAALAACVPDLPGSQLTGNAAAGPSSAGAAGAGVGGSGGAGPGTGAGMGSGGTAATSSGGIGGKAVTGAGGTDIAPPSPYLFVADAGTPQNLAVDSMFVYWANPRTGSLMRAALAGGPPMLLASGPASATGWVAVDSASVYWLWSSGPASEIDTVATAGNFQPTKVASTTTVVQQMAVNRAGIYWIEAVGPVMETGLNGGTPTQLATTQIANDVAADEQYVYWVAGFTDNGCNPPCYSIMQVRDSGGTPVQLFPPQPSGIWSLALDATHVYWIDSVSGFVMRVGKAGGTPEIVETIGVKATSVAADDSGVYWMDESGAINTAQSDGSSPRLVALAPSLPAYGITLDATSVYWIGARTGSIFRAPK